MRALTAFILLTTAGNAVAGNTFGYEFTVSPNPVPPGESIQLTVKTTDTPCEPLPPFLWPVFLPGNVLEFEIPTSDACVSPPLETRTYPVDALPAGHYTFRYVGCGTLPLPGTPGNGCVTYEEQAVVVLGFSSARFTVPATSSLVLIGLALVTAILACASLVRRRTQ